MRSDAQRCGAMMACPPSPRGRNWSSARARCARAARRAAASRCPSLLGEVAVSSGGMCRSEAGVASRAHRRDMLAALRARTRMLGTRIGPQPRGGALACEAKELAVSQRHLGASTSRALRQLAGEGRALHMFTNTYAVTRQLGMVACADVSGSSFGQEGRRRSRYEQGWK
eukprot:scaffold879_cov410-Prasinococcus_capsulatus_cf.AAC.11